MEKLQSKRVLVIAATPFFADRGCHIRIYNELKYLLKRNINLILCTYHLGYTPSDLPGDIVKRTINIPWYKKLTPGASFHKIYIDFLLLILCIKWFFKFKPSVIHAHLYEGLLIGFILKILSFGKVKLIFDCQGSLAQEMMNYTLHKNSFYKKTYPIFLFIEKLLIKLPDYTLCSSINSYNFIKEKYSVRGERIGLLEDGSDPEIFSSISDDEKLAIKKGLQIPDENKVVVYSGSLSKAKGVDALLDVLPELIEKNPKVTYVFLGYGNLVDEYRLKLEKYIDSHNVVIYGAIGYFDTARFLQIGDFAIDPKFGSTEASGKLFNYLDAGLPVICYKNEFNFDVLGESGVYIDDFLMVAEVVKSDYKSGFRVEKKYRTWKDIIEKAIEVYV